MRRRSFDLEFIRKWLGDPPKCMLDVGCGEKWPPSWNGRGFECWGVDVRNINRGERFRVEDARKMSFPDKFFDVVYSISSIEHFGLGERRYGGEVEVSGDRSAIIEMSRVLKDSGILIITVPYGRNFTWSRGRKAHRVYDDERLKELFLSTDFGIFNELDRLYLQHDERDHWYIVKKNELDEYIKEHPNDWGEICVAMSKHPR